MIKLASKENYDDTVSQEGKTLVEVYAPGCGPCERMKKDVLPNVPESIRVATIDGTANFEVIERIQDESNEIVMAVPVLVLYTDGEFQKRFNGFMSLQQVEKFIEDE